MRANIAHTKGISVYYQIIEDIVSRINNGEWKVGERIPTEMELVEYYGVSRMTLRKALDELSEEGLLYKERGVGTFAAKKQIVRNQETLLGVYEEMTSQGRIVRSEVLRKQTCKSKSIAKDLGQKPNSDIFHLQRLRYVDETKMLLDDTYLRREIGDKIADADFETQSLFDLLEKNGYTILYGNKEIQAITADGKIAKLLGCKTGLPLFFMKTVIYDKKGIPVAVSELYIRSDLYSIKITAKRK
jgi:GntR family transcriptional regulator